MPIQNLMLVLGIGVLCWVMMRGRYKSRNTNQSVLVPPSLKHNGNVSRSPGDFAGPASAGAPIEFLKYQVELYDLARQLKGELDSKIVAVRKIAADYEHAVQRLSGLIAAAKSIHPDRIEGGEMARRMLQAGCSIDQIAHLLTVPVEQVREWLNCSEPQREQPTADVP